MSYISGHPEQYAEVPKLCLEIASLRDDWHMWKTGTKNQKLVAKCLLSNTSFKVRQEELKCKVNMSAHCHA